MDTDQNKSVGVDYETWQILVEWAENECRSIGGQIRYLVREHGPQIKIEPSPEQKLLAKPFLRPEPEYVTNEGEWQTRPLSQTWFRQEPTQRSILVNTLLEYGQPATNTELMILCEGMDEHLIGEMTVDDYAKQTSGMWNRGLLKRRKSINRRYNDRYEYQLTQECLTLLSERDNKIIRKRKAT